MPASQSWKEMWPLVGKHLNQGTRGHSQTLLLTLGILHPSLRGGGAAVLTRGIEGRDDIWFSQSQLVDFECLEKGLLWLFCPFFPPGDGGS